eukprot:gene30206-35190_t
MDALIASLDPDIGSSLLEYAAAKVPYPVNDKVQIVMLECGEVVDIVVNNYDTAEHPFHMHGHTFWVMSQGATHEGVYSSSSLPHDENPMRRDTVTVNGRSHVVIRFVADNRGVWLWHCHVEWHAAAGMALIFSVDVGV